MFTMDDIISWLECEEEIEVFGDGFFATFFHKYLSENIICEYDRFLAILYPGTTDHLR